MKMKTEIIRNVGKTTWVVLDYEAQPNRLRCLRCGDSMESPAPCSIEMMLTVMRQYTKEHKGCKEPLNTTG